MCLVGWLLVDLCMHIARPSLTRHPPPYTPTTHIHICLDHPLYMHTPPSPSITPHHSPGRAHAVVGALYAPHSPYITPPTQPGAGPRRGGGHEGGDAAAAALGDVQAPRRRLHAYVHGGHGRCVGLDKALLKGLAVACLCCLCMCMHHLHGGLAVALLCCCAVLFIYLYVYPTPK